MSKDRNLFPIVGIGASAGGLEALEGVFRSLPADTGLAFIIVTHTARGQHSALGEILARYTTMPVTTPAGEVAIEPDHVYVCPPDNILTVADGRIELRSRESETQRKPIDVFLSSLAEDCGDSAVGVLLSGGGSDGTLGVKAIKERGGITIAQGGDGEGPKQTGMPDTAIAAGVIDLVLPAEEIGPRLADYARSFRMMEQFAEADRGDRHEYDEIYRILLNHVGHDFSGYKEKTFARRVRRRMQVLQILKVHDYVARLKESPEEVTLLFRGLLIGVTNFFRDPQAFTTLAEMVIPTLFEGQGVSDTIRVWVPGCATGEEVYSLAILMREHMDTLRTIPKVQLFATDIDEQALNVARAGRYPAPLMHDVSPKRLTRFFTSDDATYSVNKDIREMCIFSPHNVIRDPPFSRIDLVSCRNLLIYFGNTFQSQVVPVFHFALKPRGYLFLGTSENVSQHSDLFAPVDKKHRIFQRRDNITNPLHFSAFVPRGRPAPTSGELRREPAAMAANLRRAVENIVIERFSPAHVIVNLEGDILHYSPRTGKYLEPAAGLPNRQLLSMARRGLQLDLRTAFRQAVETQRKVERDQIAVQIDDRVQLVKLTIEPFGEHESDPLFLVVFSDIGTAAAPADGGPVAAAANGSETIPRLEQELRGTKERLQATVEEYETAVEELKSANEELQSMNEELQSTNEELETSKEEMQSINEELQTVNAELNSKVEEVDRANSDLRNVFESTRVASVFLDPNLVIRSFTPAVTSIFNLISSDRGRPLTDIASHVDTGDLKRDSETVLERGETIERSVRRLDGSTHYIMRILPYRGRNNVIDGVLVTFFDVTDIAEAEAHQRTLVEELNHRVRNMLTIVGAIASQTLSKSASIDDFAAAFQGRIQAMGSAYGLVSRENWGDVSILDLLNEQLRSHMVGNSERVQIGGPAVMLGPTAALALGMVFHELATNAVKYGALSNGTGTVSVQWDVKKHSGPRLEVAWVERGGPAVTKTGRKGLGTTLIQREVEHSLNGTVDFEYARKGLTVRISAPYGT